MSEEKRIAECVFDMTQEATAYLREFINEGKINSRELFENIYSWAGEFEESFKRCEDPSEYLPQITTFARNKLRKEYADLFETRMERLHEEIKNALSNSWFVEHAEGDQYEINLHENYDDRLSTDDITHILQSDDIASTFRETAKEYMRERADYNMDELISECKTAIEAPVVFGRKLTSEEDDELHEYIWDHVGFKYPYAHFLMQDVRIDIMLNTGDADREYTANCVSPAYGGDERLDESASVILLAKLQGYSRERLQSVLEGKETMEEGSFLESLYDEIANESGSVNVLTILAKMELVDAMKLNELIHLAESYGNRSTPAKRPDCGTVKIRKDAFTGLFDPVNGGGSLFDIKLEKDMDLPVKFIASALPDGKALGKYSSVESVYGLSTVAWKCAVEYIKAPGESTVEKEIRRLIKV